MCAGSRRQIQHLGLVGALY